MEVENFFGCYLLYSLSEKYKGRTYIGFTVNPNRRIKQHNKGLKAGGAWKTNDKGPWDMVLIIHGFPNDVSALRFEWAWQNPLKSRRLKHVPKKAPRESAFKYRFRIMAEMLQVGPWNRLPLTVQWLNIAYKTDFEISKQPPLHMPICIGPIEPRKVENSEEDDGTLNFCYICNKIVTKENKFVCLNEICAEIYHVVCFGHSIINKSSKDKKFLIPIEGCCPKCETSILWGDVIRYASGCFRKPSEKIISA